MDCKSKDYRVRRILTYVENGGTPLGKSRFQAATRIKKSAWLGKYWEKFGAERRLESAA
jgi:hypothetical protein